MRKLEYLSPSSLSKFENEPDYFYIYYLAEAHPPRPPQNEPMAIGSAIDARIKAYLSEKHDLETLFEEQVEPQLHHWAYENSEALFEKYKESGALNDLVRELQGSIIEPRYEFKVIGNVLVGGVVGEVPIMGKPDLYYVTQDNLRVILDFKVNGFCAASKVSPRKGYIKIRPGGQQHKDAFVQNYKGVQINITHPFELIDTHWADQFATYGWQLGDDEFVVGVEQFACPGNQNVEGTRFASFRGQVGKEHQDRLRQRYARAWEIVNSDWIFRNLSYRESKEKQQHLESLASNMTKENVNFVD